MSEVPGWLSSLAPDDVAAVSPKEAEAPLVLETPLPVPEAAPASIAVPTASELISLPVAEAGETPVATKEQIDGIGNGGSVAGRAVIEGAATVITAPAAQDSDGDLPDWMKGMSGSSTSQTASVESVIADKIPDWMRTEVPAPIPAPKPEALPVPAESVEPAEVEISPAAPAPETLVSTAHEQEIAMADVEEKFRQLGEKKNELDARLSGLEGERSALLQELSASDSDSAQTIPTGETRTAQLKKDYLARLRDCRLDISTRLVQLEGDKKTAGELTDARKALVQEKKKARGRPRRISHVRENLDKWKTLLGDPSSMKEYRAVARECAGYRSTAELNNDAGLLKTKEFMQLEARRKQLEGVLPGDMLEGAPTSGLSEEELIYRNAVEPLRALVSGVAETAAPQPIVESPAVIEPPAPEPTAPAQDGSSRDKTLEVEASEDRFSTEVEERATASKVEVKKNLEAVGASLGRLTSIAKSISKDTPVEQKQKAHEAVVVEGVYALKAASQAPSGSEARTRVITFVKENNAFGIFKQAATRMLGELGLLGPDGKANLDADRIRARQSEFGPLAEFLSELGFGATDSVIGAIVSAVNDALK